MDLNLPEYSFKILHSEEGKKQIFDESRRKYVALTPEEWVRQNFLQYMVSELDYPVSLISVEKGLKVNSMQKRFDAVVFNRNGKPLMLLEFKAPEVKITQKVMEQISRYNLSLNVNYLLVSNGMQHFCCYIDKKSNEIQFLREIPVFNTLSDN